MPETHTFIVHIRSPPIHHLARGMAHNCRKQLCQQAQGQVRLMAGIISFHGPSPQFYSICSPKSKKKVRPIVPEEKMSAANAIVATKALSKGSNRFGRRDSLIKQASLDRVQNEGLRRQNTIQSRKELERSSTLCKPLLQRLNDDSVELIKTASDDRNLNLLLILHCGGDSRDVLQLALHRFLGIGLHLTHLETRPDLAQPGELEMRAQLSGKKWMFLEALTKLVLEKTIERIELRHLEAEKLAREPETDGKGGEAKPTKGASVALWFPRHVSELDKCAHVLVKYEPTEDPKHPGFGDQRYIERRAQLNELANTFRFGEAFPLVEYTQEEHNTWRVAYLQLKELRESHTCKEYQRNVAEMERVGLIGADRIPQIRELSAYIQRKTGFELRPCGGLLSARDFLASLAFRVFQATLYVRHSSAPHHCPEPDVIHEVLGHCPMFADENLAQMSQDIGLLSLGATDEQIERLATVYWFIVEFGLCRQDGQLRAIGAGLLSAYGELKFACSDGPEHEVFKPEVTALRPYEDSDYQPVYFVADSIEKAMEDVRAYARSLCPYRTNLYNPLTRTIQEIPTKVLLQHRMAKLQRECGELQKMMERNTSENIED